MTVLCKYCGWPLPRGGHPPKLCETCTEAEQCPINKENVRKFVLRFRDEPVPNIVRSTRHQGPDKGGDSFEFLERVE